MSQDLMKFLIVAVLAIVAVALVRTFARIVEAVRHKMPGNAAAIVLRDLANSQGNTEQVLKVAKSSEHGRKMVEHFYPGFLDKIDLVLKVAGFLRNRPEALDLSASTIANLTPTDIDTIAAQVVELDRLAVVSHGDDDYLLKTKLSDLLKRIS
jgi:hypothetical protein